MSRPPESLLKMQREMKRQPRQASRLAVENEKLREAIEKLVEAFAREGLGPEQWTAMQEAKRLIGRK